MKTQDFFQMSKKYIFKTCLKCGKNQDSKFTMNYELVVNIDFREDEIYITNKQKEYLYEIKYTDIISIDFMICPRYTSGTKIARRDYNIAYTIHMNNQSFYFESMSYLIWNDILMLLNRKGAESVSALGQPIMKERESSWKIRKPCFWRMPAKSSAQCCRRRLSGTGNLP